MIVIIQGNKPDNLEKKGEKHNSERMKIGFFVVMTAFLITSIVGISLGQSAISDEYSPGMVFVKFKPGEISQISETLAAQDIVKEITKEYLKRVGFTEGIKVFKDAKPSDTTAISLTGEIVKQMMCRGGMFSI